MAALSGFTSLNEMGSIRLAAQRRAAGAVGWRERERGRERETALERAETETGTERERGGKKEHTTQSNRGMTQCHTDTVRHTEIHAQPAETSERR